MSGHSDPVTAAGRALAAGKISGPVTLVGADFLPLKYWRLLDAAASGTSWVEDETLVQRTRRIKSTAEMEVFRKAGVIATRALGLLMEGLVAVFPRPRRWPKRSAKSVVLAACVR